MSDFLEGKVGPSTPYLHKPTLLTHWFSSDGPCDVVDHLSGARLCPLCHPTHEVDVRERDLPMELL